MMQRILTTLLLLAVSCGSLWAQNADERLAPVKTPLQEVASLSLPILDNKELKENEMARRGPGIAPRFAENIYVDVAPSTHGTWEDLENGRMVWRLRVPSPGAKSINLGFDRFVMPPGGTMILYSPDYQDIQGPFSPADNDEHEQLWTPVLEGDELVIEVSVPVEMVPHLDLHLKTVNHDFIGFGAAMLSGSCNLDVVCGAEDGWGIVDGYRDIIQSVAVIAFGGGTFCTGFLVNNARQDCTPFFMTADHCGVNSSNAASLVVYWNFINSVCRQPDSPASGGAGDGTLTDFNTGSIFRAGYSPSDMALVELDDPVSETANAFFAGWDAGDEPAQDTIIAVHHPSTDEKRISFEFDGTYRGSWGSGSTPVPSGNHLVVADWDIGTTEGGSSGSPLFNNDKQVIGQLHGGGAACGNNSYDSYGWFHTSWEGGGTSSSSLRPWLDPDNTGVTAIDGRAQLLCSFFVLAEPASQNLCAPEDALFQLSVSENFTGPVTITLEGLPAELTATFDATTVDPGGSTQLLISDTDQVPSGVYDLTLIGTDGANMSEQQLELKISDGLPLQPVLANPADAANNQGLVTPLIWVTLPTAENYDVQLANDEGFTDLVQEWTNVSDNSVLSPTLVSGLTYYWRVRAHNICGEGDWAAAYSFTTGQISCGVLSSSDVPVNISSGPTGTYESELVITQPGIISSLSVIDLDISHTYVGDLDATLVSPDGISVVLFSTPGGGNCFGDDLLVSFSDAAANTATDFANTCNNNPAIQGLYQPLGSLALFAGEEAMGTWTLIINDNAFQDGGSINGWSLDICSVVPSAVSLVSNVDAVEACEGETTGLELSLGTGFSSNSINLSVSGLPADAVVNFEENPAAAGSTVDVSIGGISQAGTYIATFTASDGTDMATTSVEVIILPPPSAPNLQVPMDGATDVLTATSLFWENISEATGYTIVLSTNPDLSDPILEANPAFTNYPVDGLDNNTVYYWSVQTQGACGPSDFENVFSFTTIPDLTFNALNTELSGCTTDDLNVLFTVGEGLGDELTVTLESEPDATFAIEQSFDIETRELSLTLGELFMNTPGSYDVTVTVTGEGYSNSQLLSVIILEAPSLPSLEGPLNGETIINGDSIITFNWTGVAAADNYTVDVATDDTFNNIVASGTVSSTTTDLMVPSPNQYFWRVTATNECGDAITAAFNFVYEVVSVQEIAGISLEVLPNPTTGPLQLRLSGSLPGDLVVEGFAANGQRLQAWRVPAVAGTHQLDISQWPAGVYTFRISNGRAQITERIVLMR